MRCKRARRMRIDDAVRIVHMSGKTQLHCNINSTATSTPLQQGRPSHKRPSLTVQNSTYAQLGASPVRLQLDAPQKPDGPLPHMSSRGPSIWHGEKDERDVLKTAFPVKMSDVMLQMKAQGDIRTLSCQTWQLLLQIGVLLTNSLVCGWSIDGLSPSWLISSYKCSTLQYKKNYPGDFPFVEVIFTTQPTAFHG